MLKQIADESLLAVTSKKLIKRLLHEYGRLSGAPLGVPRGVGVSAYLSELYMRRFDETIQAQPDVLYYARYVDDIIIICVPPPDAGVREIRRTLVRALRERRLTRNRTKTREFWIDGSTHQSVDYLGYNFTFGTGNVKVSLTNVKRRRYELKTRLAFEDYVTTSAWNEPKARRLLVQRIKFLTGNVDSKLKRNFPVFVENFLGCSIPESLTWSIIESLCDAENITIRHESKV